MKRQYSHLIVAAIFSVCGGLTHAEQYQSGVTSWQVKEGKLMLVAGVLTDNSRLYYLNYSLYLEEPDKALVMIPIVKDETRLHDYDLHFNTFNGGGEIISDAMVVVKGENTWFVTAHKKAMQGYGSPGSITTQTYRLFHGGEVQWKYYFVPVARSEYTEQKNYTVERALSETERTLH
ncbi:hypothetical protein BWP39_25990 [Paraburkholderia acidicola]|uniref:Uncharacterized protein n=1 Tax=Paraburkholderia acidicola TaxID=1912599 RepID=A0A2A4ERU6_9BURK|nr:hypothetical protein [Paraburkholderia acidicola]PCE23140.1 hypothetical protein BWP39_25990 [Paraburkholderia acidicola]